MKNSPNHNLLVASVIINIGLIVALVIVGSSATRYEHAAQDSAKPSTADTVSNATNLETVVALDEQLLSEYRFLVQAQRDSMPETSSCPTSNFENCVTNNKNTVAERTFKVQDLTEKRNQLVSE